MDKKERLKKQNKLSLAILIGGTILSLILFGPKKEKIETVEEKPAKMVKVIELGSEKTQKAQVKRSATFDSILEAQVVVEYTGRITEIYFETGQYVFAGQVLAKFDQSDRENSSKVALQTSQQNLALAQDNLEKTKEVVDEGLELAKNARKVAEIQLEQARESGTDEEVKLAKRNLENAKDAEEQAEKQAEITVNNAQLAVNQSVEAVRQNRIAYEKTIIRAPISGVVSAKNINQFDYFSFGQVVAQIVGGGKLKTKIYLNQDEIGRVAMGDEVKILLGGEEHSGKIVSFSPIANENNGRFEVRIESDEELSAQANQTAEIILSLRLKTDQADSFFVPLQAINIGQMKNTAFVEEEGVAQQREVTLGQTVDDQVEVLSGLKEGEELIVENNRQLRDGEEVRVEAL